MEWFEGTVNEALNDYQQKQGILVVFVYAENDSNSQKFDELWKTFDTAIIGALPYVAIRLEKNSAGAVQFSQFFPTLTIPVTYILGLNAAPLEVITMLQELTREQLQDAFVRAITLYKDQLKEQGIPLKEAEKPVEVQETPSSQDAKTEEEMMLNEEETEATKGLTLDEKVEKVRQIIEEKKKIEAKKTEEEERLKEIKRREEGKAMAEFREKQREKELRESAEARRRQKEEDAAALKRIREQLKADKEERAKRNKGGEPAEAAKQEVQAADKTAATSEAINKPVNTDECRIQCRFPDGSTLNLVLPSKDPLQSVHDAVCMDARKPANFFLVQPYPRRKLTEMEKSLLDYGLTPSSVILVISFEGGTGSSYASIVPTGYLQMLLGFIYFPFTALYQFFLSLANIGGRQPANGGQQQNAKVPKKKEQKADERAQRDGNIQRFRNEEDGRNSDDNEATWNGNSTQQL